MTDDFKQFDIELDEFAREVPEMANKFKRAIALDLLTRVVFNTPVDTGHLRGNWQVGISAAKEGELRRTDKGGGQAIASGSKTIGRAQPGDDIWLSNNLPYAEYIEEGGYRVQSPLPGETQGGIRPPGVMVEKSLAELQAKEQTEGIE